MQKQDRGRVMALRNERVAKLLLPVKPGVTVIEVRAKTEYVRGRPVVRYFLPEGSTIQSEKNSHNNSKTTIASAE